MLLLQQQQLRRQAKGRVIPGEQEALDPMEESVAGARHAPDAPAAGGPHDLTHLEGVNGACEADQVFIRSPNHRVDIDEHGVTFSFASAAHSFDGPGARDHLAPVLEAVRVPATRREIVRGLDPTARARAERGLSLLEANGLVVRLPAADAVAPSLATAHLAAANQYGLSPQPRSLTEVIRRLDDAVVVVIGTGIVADEVRRQLQSLPMAMSSDTAATELADFVIVAPDPHDDDAIDAAEPLARNLVDVGTPWTMISAFDGQLITVGPVVLGGETACHECARRRRTAATQLGTRLHRLTGRTGAVTSLAVAAVAAGLATHQALRWVATEDPQLPGRLSAYRPFDATVSEHLVLRVPRCPLCGPSLPASSPWSATTSPETKG